VVDIQEQNEEATVRDNEKVLRTCEGKDGLLSELDVPIGRPRPTDHGEELDVCYGERGSGRRVLSQEGRGIICEEGRMKESLNKFKPRRRHMTCCGRCDEMSLPYAELGRLLEDLLQGIEEFVSTFLWSAARPLPHS